MDPKESGFLKFDLDEKLREACSVRRSLVDEGADSQRPGAKASSMMAVGTSQMDRMIKVANFFTGWIKHDPAIGDRAMGIIREWAGHDRDPERQNVCADDFFPLLIKGKGEKEFPVDEPAAVLTQYGHDQLLFAYSRDNSIGITPDEAGTAFVGNYADWNSGGTIHDVVEGRQLCVVRGMGLYITPKSSVGIDHLPEGDCGLSYTEGWHTRMSELRRFPPYHVTSLYEAWIVLFQRMDLDWDEVRRRGGFHLLVGCLYLACEWACSIGVPMRKTASPDDGGANGILNAWATGSTPSIPYWMHAWRQPMSYTYVRASDVGYGNVPYTGIMEWSRSALRTEVGDSQERVTPSETRMPFVERSDGAYPFQSCALTTGSIIRFWLCYSTCVEVCGSMHIDALCDGGTPMADYYEASLAYLGSRPGALGRKLGKTVVKLSRLLLCNYSAEVPVGQIPVGTSSGAGLDMESSMTSMHDQYLLAILAAAQGCDNSEASVLTSIAAEIPRLSDAMHKIFQYFGPNSPSLDLTSITSMGSAFADVITHLSHPGVLEGYSRSCLGSLPVKGYKSRAQREIIEGIDISAENRGVDPFEVEVFRELLSGIRPPSTSDIDQAIRASAMATSAGNNSVAIRVTRRDVLGDARLAGATTRERFTSNRKDMVYYIAPYVLSSATLLHQPSERDPFPLGLRSVPARVLRYVYNLPYPQQVVLRAIYSALKTRMKRSDKGFDIEQKTGIPVADAINYLNISIMLARDPRLLCAAIDASSLDQHIGSAHRRNWRQVMDEELADAPESNDGYLQRYGVKFRDVFHSVMDTWDDGVYHVPIPGAPSQLLFAETQPSGALTTGSDNTVVTYAMLDYISHSTGQVHMHQHVWGDDCFVTVNIASQSGADAVNLIKQQDSLALGAGQVLGTLKDSTSGRAVHFLQRLYASGQVMSRLMTVDAEKAQETGVIPGNISEIVSKMVDKCGRGGNGVQLNMLVLSTMMCGSHGAVFGRQSSTNFDSMVYSEGTLGRNPLGFSLPSCRLFLKCFSDSILERPNIEVYPRVKLETPYNVGKRVIDAVKSGDGVMMVRIAGNLSFPANVGDLQKGASGVLLDRTRVARISSLHAAELERMGLDEHSYTFSVEKAGYTALGSRMMTGTVYAKKFAEKALVEANFIPTRTEKYARPTKNVTQPSRDPSFRVGNKMLTFSISDEFFISPPLLPRGAVDNLRSMFLVVNASGHIERSFPQRWHPYYATPYPNRTLLSLTGVHAGRNAFSAKSKINIFNPSHFRSDLTPENVMEGVSKLLNKSGNLIHSYLLSVGFNEDEIRLVTENLDKIPLIRDVEKTEEYSSLSDLLKSAGTDRIDEIMRVSSPSLVDWQSRFGTDATYSIMRTHFTALLYEVLNSYSALSRSDGKTRVYLPLPICTVSDLTG